jgi:hypothetical protein
MGAAKAGGRVVYLLFEGVAFRSLEVFPSAEKTPNFFYPRGWTMILYYIG